MNTLTASERIKCIEMAILSLSDNGGCFANKETLRERIKDFIKTAEGQAVE